MGTKLNKNANDGWSPFPPEEPGSYWFYGYMWASKNTEYHERDKMSLEFVVVSKVSNGIMFVAKGAFIYPHSAKERHFGLWKRIDVPETDMLDGKVNELADLFYSHEFE